LADAACHTTKKNTLLIRVFLHVPAGCVFAGA